MSGPADREIEQLERDLEETDDPEERAAIIRALRDIAHEESERERWEDEGRERGWHQ